MTTNIFLKQYPSGSHSWTGNVIFCFGKPIAGWIQLVVLSDRFLQGVIIKLSSVFNPFPELEEWLSAIVDGNLPAEFSIDEEGIMKTFRATAVNEDEFVFEILAGFWGEEREERPVYMYVQVSKVQFLSEFLRRWDYFLENDYNPVSWDKYSDLREMDVSKVRTFLSR